jgi:multiple sugar transport system ATP-binding protein
MNIYRRPANRFVASFIGSPAMNFLSGAVQGGVFRFVQGNNGEVPAGGVEVGRAVPDGTAVLGVRPEDLVPNRDGAGLGTVLIDVVEHMGHETLAHFALAGGHHVARLPANTAVQPGDQVPLAIRPGGYHLFSADDGRRLN